MKTEILQLIMAAVGTLGFSIYFRVSEKNVFFSTLGGAIGWAIYLLIYHFTSQLFVANFVASLVLLLYGKLMARCSRTPTDIFLIPGIIPLLPGGTLYYTMLGLVNGNDSMFIENLKNTGVITFGITTGIVLGTVIITYITRIVEKRKAKNPSQNNS